MNLPSCFTNTQEHAAIGSTPPDSCEAVTTPQCTTDITKAASPEVTIGCVQPLGITY